MFSLIWVEPTKFHFYLYIFFYLPFEIFVINENRSYDRTINSKKLRTNAWIKWRMKSYQWLPLITSQWISAEGLAGLGIGASVWKWVLHFMLFVWGSRRGTKPNRTIFGRRRLIINKVKSEKNKIVYGYLCQNMLLGKKTHSTPTKRAF